MSRTRKARCKRQRKPGLNANCVQAQPGADGGTRTHMVSRTILSRLRLPFRHIGLWECPGCGPAPCRRLTAGAGPETLQSPVHLAQQTPGHALCIPPHRLIMYVIIAYPACKIKRKVSLSANSGRRGRAAQMGAPGGDFAPPGAGAGGALAAALMVSFLAGAGHLFSKRLYK